MLIDIGGVKAYTMLDSGSTSDSLSPDFTQVAGLKVHTLARPLNVQLGTVGSQSKINYGTSTRLKLGSVDEEYYFDVFNIDRYDCILGIPFIRKFRLLLDLANNSIIIDGKRHIALTTEEDTVEQVRRSASRIVSTSPETPEDQ